MLSLSSAALSYGAGNLVAFSPCVLPALPLIASGASRESRLGPLVVAAGLVTGFTAVGVSIAGFGHIAGLSQENLRTVGATAIGLAGLVMLVKPLEALVSQVLAPVAALAGGGQRGGGTVGQFGLGAGLGMVWAPCSGPALGAALGLAAQAGGLGEATLLMLLFGMGAATPLLLAAYGSRNLMLKLRSGAAAAGDWGKRLLGGALLAVSGLTLSGLDLKLQDWLTQRLPDWWLTAVTSL